MFPGIAIRVTEYLKALKAKTIRRRVNAIVSGYWSADEMAKITLSKTDEKKKNKSLITDENIEDILSKSNWFIE